MKGLQHQRADRDLLEPIWLQVQGRKGRVHHEDRNRFNQLSSDRKSKSGESFTPLLKCVCSAVI